MVRAPLERDPRWPSNVSLWSRTTPAFGERYRSRSAKLCYQVIEAEDGREAMRLWRDQGADLVITDILMPDKNGLEVIIELQALSPSTPIVVITDGGQSKQIRLLEENARLLGAIRAVAKPFRLEEMLAVVAQELRA